MQTKRARSIVVFDFGGVLVDWDPRYLYRDLFQGDETDMEWFLANVCNDDFVLKCDGGIPFHETANSLSQKHPTYKDKILAYLDQVERQFGPPIEGSVKILTELLEAGIPLYAITNWSHESFPRAVQLFPFFSWFKGVVVSGTVKMLKPDPKIFHHLLKTYSLKAKDCVFIDDRLENVEAAKKLGFAGIHFKNPNQLRAELQALKLI